MKVEEVVEAMSHYNPESEIVVIWYTRDEFEIDDEEVPLEVWQRAVARFEKGREYEEQVMREGIDEILYQETK